MTGRTIYYTALLMLLFGYSVGLTLGWGQYQKTVCYAVLIIVSSYLGYMLRRSQAL